MDHNSQWCNILARLPLMSQFSYEIHIFIYLFIYSFQWSIYLFLFIFTLVYYIMNFYQEMNEFTYIVLFISVLWKRILYSYLSVIYIICLGLQMLFVVSGCNTCNENIEENAVSLFGKPLKIIFKKFYVGLTY